MVPGSHTISQYNIGPISMSTSFLPSSIESVEAVSNVAPRVLEMVKELEEISQKLSRRLEILTKSKKSHAVHSEEIEVIRNTISNIFQKKSALVMSCYDLIDQKVKYIDQMTQSVIELIQISSSQSGIPHSVLQNSVERRKRARNSDDSQSRKEPLYCTCNREAFGAMIACDNDQCAIEWFHYSCVGLVEEPSEWLCRQCQNAEKEKNSRISDVLEEL